MHPNAMKENKPSKSINDNAEDEEDETNKHKKEKKGCSYYFKLFDQAIVRPILIYKYKTRIFEKEVKFNELLEETKEGNFEVASAIGVGLRTSMPLQFN